MSFSVTGSAIGSWTNNIANKFVIDLPMMHQNYDLEMKLERQREREFDGFDISVEVDDIHGI